MPPSLSKRSKSSRSSKSISKGTGRSSYRGLCKVYEGATSARSNVECDALLINETARSDTYPYIEIEEENNNFANLYVASFQLHSTLDFKEAVQIVMEIVTAVKEYAKANSIYKGRAITLDRDESGGWIRRFEARAN